MFPLTGDPQINKDLAEEHQRRLLEAAEADKIAQGDPDVHEGDYQPITDNEDDLLNTARDNRNIKGKSRE